MKENEGQGGTGGKAKEKKINYRCKDIGSKRGWVGQRVTTLSNESLPLSRETVTKTTQ